MSAKPAHRTAWVISLDIVIVLSIIAFCAGFVIGAHAW